MRFEIGKAADPSHEGESWRWRLIEEDGNEVVATREGFASKVDCYHNAISLKMLVGQASITVLKDTDQTGV